MIYITSNDLGNHLIFGGFKMGVFGNRFILSSTSYPKVQKNHTTHS